MGTDYGAISNQFFTRIAKQIQDRYFEMLENSNRYILKHSVTIEEATFLGQLFSMFILYNVHIDFYLSFMILGHVMFFEKNISYDELFLYYILDLEPKKGKQNMEICSMPDIPCVPKEIVQSYIEDIYDYQSKVFKTFTRMFLFKKKTFYSTFYDIHDKVRMYDLDKLLTYHKISPASYKKYVFERMRFRFKKGDENYEVLTRDSQECYLCRVFEDMLTSSDEFDDLYANCKINDVRKEAFKTKTNYCKALFMFWTGLEGINVTGGYLITINPNIDEIISHACFYELEFPYEKDYLENMQQLYDAFMMIFIYDVHQIFASQ